MLVSHRHKLTWKWCKHCDIMMCIVLIKQDPFCCKLVNVYFALFPHAPLTSPSPKILFIFPVVVVCCVSTYILMLHVSQQSEFPVGSFRMHCGLERSGELFYRHLVARHCVRWWARSKSHAFYIRLQQYTGVPVHRDMFCHNTNIVHWTSYRDIYDTFTYCMHQQTWESTVFN